MKNESIQLFAIVVTKGGGYIRLEDRLMLRVDGTVLIFTRRDDAQKYLDDHPSQGGIWNGRPPVVEEITISPKEE